jgi:hypothetical protein
MSAEYSSLFLHDQGVGFSVKGKPQVAKVSRQDSRPALLEARKLFCQLPQRLDFGLCLERLDLDRTAIRKPTIQEIKCLASFPEASS